jgi:hypothetical protein
VQIYETAFKRCKLITNPASRIYDNDSSIMWLVGAVEEGTEECFFQFVEIGEVIH